ncbi:MAG: T9SS type A sorting domain-containing protein [Bacteroides sp.]|nr:T9SS type A sorting domain-containing protein [Bacteroides sp.]MCM1085009.1 T9SS type A sorting domain-containing protein [Bacteroides sp.]
MKKMKFLIGALSFLATTFAASSAQAQTKTYFLEDFQTGKMSTSVWNLNSCTKISEEEGPLYIMYLDEARTKAAGGYIYDPQGQIVQGGLKTPIDGSYELITNPISLDADVINVISLDVDFQASSNNSARNFGIRIREKDNSTWDTIMMLKGLGASIEQTFVAALDNKWAGKSDVELEILFNNKHVATTTFYFFIDNFKLSAYPMELGTSDIKMKMVSPPFLAESSFDENTKEDFNLSFSNTSALLIDSAQYAFSINGEAPQIKNITFSPALEMITGSASITQAINLSAAHFGENQMKIWPVSFNGNEVNATGQDTLSWIFTVIDASTLNQDYVPLMECFTASWCGPCNSMNQYLNPALEELRNEGKINVIKYQCYGDAYYIPACDYRSIVYDDLDGAGYIPFPVYNGEDNISSWSNYYAEMMTTLKQKATAAHAQKAMADITITKAEADANTGSLALNFSVTTPFSGKVSVFAAVTEKTTTGNVGTNREKEFHWVAMDMPTTGNGALTEFEKGVAKDFSYTVNLKKTHMEEITDLEVVCFVQDIASKKIFQSASVSVAAQNVANEDEVMGDVRVYPNPAFENVNITNLDGADVEIFDLTGRRVYFSNNVNGDLLIATSAFAQGTYVVRLTKDGQSAHRKLVVVR